MFKKLWVCLAGLVTFFALAVPAYAEELQHLPFHGQYSAQEDNNGIDAIYFEQDRVVFSFREEIKKEKDKGPTKNDSWWGRVMLSAQNWNKATATEKKSVQAQINAMPNVDVKLYLPDMEGYNNRYGKYYVELKNPIFKKVDSQYVISAKDDTGALDAINNRFILTEAGGILTDAQGGHYKKALPIHLIVASFIGVVVVAVAVIMVKQKKLIG